MTLRALAYWPPQLDRLLARIPGDCPPAWYRAEWEAGRLELLAFGCPDQDRAFLLWRKELAPDGRDELVMVAGVGPAIAGPAIAPELLAAIEDHGRAQRCATVRLHTQRPGVVARCFEAGWHQAEVIMRKGLADGR